ncbi:MAG: hypothetical protein RLZZ618_437, partial [Pseudomonadota bacterium]
IAPTPTQNATTPAFFAVSVAKLVVLSMCTMGMYQVYWFYKNWEHIRLRDQPGIWSFPRAFFGVIFCYSCFSHIRKYGLKTGVTPALPAGVLAVAWILTTFVWKLPDPFWLLGFASVLWVVPVQTYVNQINTAVAPEHDPNRRFTGWNWFGVVVGGGLLVLMLIGTFMPVD